jgi:hypothetical protein
MKQKGERSHLAGARGAGFNVYVLRDPRDGRVSFVGLRRDEDQAVPWSVDAPELPSDQHATRALVDAIHQDGRQVDCLLIASGLASRPFAVTIQQAAISAIQFAAPARAGVATTNYDFAGDRRGTNTVSLDRSSANRAAIPAPTEPTFSTLDRDEPTSANSSDYFLDDKHRRRLEQLILQQAAEMAQSTAALDRVRALRDFAEWADRTAGGSETGGTIRVSDLTQALMDASAENPRAGRC